MAQEKTILITELKENEDNPRTITQDNLNKLVRSILTFPQMLQIRKPVISADGTILGGNMRFRALSRILTMTDEEMTDAVEKVPTRALKDAEQVSRLVERWKAWQDKPEVEVIEEEFDKYETPQFVIKDNVSAGEWDLDALENFNQDDLEEWGVSTWGSIDDYMDYDNAGTSTCDRLRVIITYPRERIAEMQAIIGKEELKPNYRLEELCAE